MLILAPALTSAAAQVIPAKNSYSYATTATSVELCGDPCIFLGVIIGTAEASSSVEFYDQTGTGCSTTPITKLDTSAVGKISYGIHTTTGLCMKTIGLTTGNITAIYK